MQRPGPDTISSGPGIPGRGNTDDDTGDPVAGIPARFFRKNSRKQPALSPMRVRLPVSVPAAGHAQRIVSTSSCRDLPAHKNGSGIAVSGRLRQGRERR
jgi:hypothetical protein